MKVLVISSKYLPEYAGSGLRAHNTYKRLKNKYDVDFDVLTNSIEFNNNTRYEHEGVCVIRIAKRLPIINKSTFLAKLVNHLIYLINYIYQGFLTWRVISKGDYDLIHTFGSSVSINIGIFYAKFNNKPLLREICNNGTEPEPLLPLKLNKVFKHGFNKKTKVVAISRRIAKACQKSGLSKELLWTRPNPVEEKRFCVDHESKIVLRRKLTKFHDNDIVLVNINKFAPGKNQIFLIDVMKLLGERYKLLLFGPIVSSGPLKQRDKEYLASIKEAIEAKDLDERIQVITAFSDHIEEYFKLGDVFVFPTLFEALGTPMLESIACGIPVVANRIEDVTDCWIEEGKTGYICELEPRKFADSIVKACRIKPEILRQGSEDILSRVSSEVIDEQYFKLMQDMIGSSSN